MSDTKKTAAAAEAASLQEDMDAVMRKYDRESANGSCGLYVYERCEKDAYGGWSRQEAQILNIYAYRYWEDIAVASGKTGWGDAPSREYSELTGE